MDYGDKVRQVYRKNNYIKKGITYMSISKGMLFFVG